MLRERRSSRRHGDFLMRTYGVVLREPGRPLAVEELDVPAPAAGQVLVELAYSGVCRTQWAEICGDKGPDRFLPHTLGHEGAGTVLAIGANVAKVRPGDKVVCTWIKTSGADIPSSSYGSRSGPVNSGAIATFMRHALVSENRVVPVRPAMPLREAALLGCAVPTGAGVIRNTLQPTAGESVAILGVGGVGLCALLAAGAAGAHPLVAVDVVGARLEKALAFGATHAVDASRFDAAAGVRAATGGHGAHYVIESAGRKEMMEAALGALRAGGTAVLAGNLAAGEHIQIDPMELIRGKRLIGTWGGATSPDLDIPAYVDQYLAGSFPVDKLIFREYPLADINRAFEDLAGRIVGRGMIALAA